jgi:membrane-bound ClpP family serine protease
LFGAISVIIAGLLLFLVFQGFSFNQVTGQIQIALAIAAIVTAIILAFLLYKAVRANFLKVKTGREALIGSRGTAISDLKPKGEVRVMSEFWQAKVKDGWIKSGEEVEVVEMEGLFLVVRSVIEKA